MGRCLPRLTYFDQLKRGDKAVALAIGVSLYLTAFRLAVSHTPVYFGPAE